MQQPSVRQKLTILGPLWHRHWGHWGGPGRKLVTSRSFTIEVIRVAQLEETNNGREKKMKGWAELCHTQYDNQIRLNKKKLNILPHPPSKKSYKISKYIETTCPCRSCIQRLHYPTFAAFFSLSSILDHNFFWTQFFDKPFFRNKFCLGLKILVWPTLFGPTLLSKIFEQNFFNKMFFYKIFFDKKIFLDRQFLNIFCRIIN